MRNEKESSYFHPRPFVGNNIEFRTGSSAALGRFKESQTFILNQLAMNPFHTFSRSAKEILLLKYDMWFDFLCELEQYFLIYGDTVNHKEIIRLADKRRQYVYDTLRNCGIVDLEYLNMYKKALHTLREFQEVSLLDILASNVYPASKFGMIVDLSIHSLNHILYILQEVDILFSKHPPVLILDTISCQKDRDDCSYAVNRISLYSTKRDISEIIIKSYLDFEIPIPETRLGKYLKEQRISYTIL